MPAEVDDRVVVCAACHGSLLVTEQAVSCEACGWRRTLGRGFLPLCKRATAPPRGLGPRAMHWRPLARVYDRLWRPAFVRIAARGRPNLAAEKAWVETHLASSLGGHVVDLSCGPGHMARHLADTGRYAAVYAVDLSDVMLEQCVASCGDTARSVVAVRADVGRLPFADGSIAGAHAGAALHLWPDPLRALKEVARVLRPGGVLVASTFVHPASYGPQHAVEDAFERVTKTRFYARGELASLCAAAGLVGYEVWRRNAWVLFSVRSIA